MPRKTPLRSFLRKEILRNRIKTAPLKRRRQTSPKITPGEPHELDYLFDEDAAVPKEAGSLFGDQFAEKIKVEKLQRLLSESNRTRDPARKDRDADSPLLKEMRKELERLVTQEGEADLEGKSKLRHQKRALIHKLAFFEAEENEKKARELKSSLDEMSKCMPACGPGERKILIAKADRIYQAFAGIEKVPLKRQRENIDDDLDLDGEDRLAMGRTFKRPATKVTGRWGATLHDYFPDVEGQGGSSFNRDALTAEQKSLNRRELAALGEVLAQAERKKKKKLKLLC